jgi:plasmid stabilization system protein ParE
VSAEYSVKPKAVRDLDDYADYLAEQAHLDVVLRFFDAAHRTFALLATQPTWAGGPDLDRQRSNRFGSSA